MEKKVTTNEILAAINEFASATEDRFISIERRMATKEDLATTKLELIDHVDRKIAEVRADVTAMMRGSNDKTVELVKTLKRRKAITAPDSSNILGMQPFPITP